MSVGTYAERNEPSYRQAEMKLFTLTRVEEFLKQFTTKNRKTKDENGYSKLRWVKICNRNEAFDIILSAYSGVKMTNLVLNGKG